MNKDAREMYTKVASIHFEGEELFPYRLLPDDGGVEFRSDYMYEFHTVKDEDRLILGELTNAIAHCQKLLVDLPIALENSQSAMKEHADSEEVDLNTLGAKVMEQKRLRQEIAHQQSKLPLLEEDRLFRKAQASARLTVHIHQTSLTLPFGMTTLADERCTYTLYAIRPLPSASSTAADPPKATMRLLVIE